MAESDGKRRGALIEASAAAGLLLWRIVVLPAPALLRDWVAILAIYWVFTIFAQRSKAWPWVTLATMLLLAGIYLHGQFPYTLDVLGIRL